MTPIFDSLCHPDSSETGITSISELSSSMDLHGISRACAVSQVAATQSHSEFIETIKKEPRLIPVGAIKNAFTRDWRREITELKDLGYTGVKIHPRHLELSADSPTLREIFAAIFDAELTAFYCTYPFDDIDRISANPFQALVSQLKGLNNRKVVLLHGGDIDLLRYAQLVRHNEGLLLDLSHTLVKYAGSSLDADMRFLFSRFDQRTCVGSDHPEWSHQSLRERFDNFSRGIAGDKVERIGFSNLENFLGI